MYIPEQIRVSGHEVEESFRFGRKGVLLVQIERVFWLR